MSIIPERHRDQRAGHDPQRTVGRAADGAGATGRSAAPQHADATKATSAAVARYTAALVRLGMGWIFLWAFLDKTFGLGHETTAAQAWVNGGSPTDGFLSSAARGPFTDFYHDIAGAAWADWLFMVGLAAIGVALLLGIAMRLAATAGAVLLVLMWSVVLPPANDLFMDDHLIYALTLILLTAVGAGRTLGIGSYWRDLPLVRRNRWLA